MMVLFRPGNRSPMATNVGVVVVVVVVGRPVSDSPRPTVFSLARRLISLAFLAKRAEREKQV